MSALAASIYRNDNLQDHHAMMRATLGELRIQVCKGGCRRQHDREQCACFDLSQIPSHGHALWYIIDLWLRKSRSITTSLSQPIVHPPALPSLDTPTTANRQPPAHVLHVAPTTAAAPARPAAAPPAIVVGAIARGAAVAAAAASTARGAASAVGVAAVVAGVGVVPVVLAGVMVDQEGEDLAV